MADAVVIQEFLATLGYRVDEASQRRFIDSLESIGKTVAGLGLGLVGLAGTIAGVVSSMAGSASQMNFVAQNLGESVTNIERLIYMWGRLGVAPDAVIKGLQTIQQMRLTDPGTYAIFSSEDFGGKGTPTEQLEHFLQKFRTQSEAERRITLDRFKGFDFSMLMTAASRGDQAATGGREFDLINQRFHFDPEKFAKESTAFEQAWMSFHQRLNTWYKANIAGPLQVLETQGLIALSDWVDQHAPEITKKLEDMGRDIRDAFMVGVDVIKDLINYFERLPPGAKHAAEAITAIGIALAVLQTNPTILALAALGYALKKLLDDYEAWKKAGSSGPSPLGIDYAKIGKDFEYILTKIDDAAKAVGGWQNALLDLALAIGGAKFLGIFLRTFAAIQTAAVATGTAIAGEIGGSLAAATVGLTTVLGATLALKGDEHLTDDQKKQRDKRTEDEARQYFQEHPDWAQQHPDDARRLGVVPGQQAPQAPPTPQQGQPGQPGQQQEPSWFRRLMDLVIPQAHAEELPQNLKQVNTSLGDLKDSLDQWQETLLEMMLGKEFGDGGGGGPGGGGTGGSRGSGGGGGGPVNWKDPNVIQALGIFQGMGYSMDDAIGIVTNLWAESGLKTGAVNPTGHVGVAQWDRQRQAEFFMLNHKRVQEATLEEQLKFIDWELHHKEQAALARLQQAKGVREKAVAVGRYYERPGDEAEIQRRGDLTSKVPSSLWSTGAVSNFNNQRAATITVNNTNNVAATDPGLAANELDRMHQRQWSDLQRRLQPTFH